MFPLNDDEISILSDVDQENYNTKGVYKSPMEQIFITIRDFLCEVRKTRKNQNPFDYVGTRGLHG